MATGSNWFFFLFFFTSIFFYAGTPFTFEEGFVLVLYFSAPGEITSLQLLAQGQSTENV